MKQYPDDGKEHPTLSDWWREVWGALPDGSSLNLYLIIFAVVAVLYYPDWRTIAGMGLVLVGIWGVMYMRSRSR